MQTEIEQLVEAVEIATDELNILAPSCLNAGLRRQAIEIKDAQRRLVDALFSLKSAQADRAKPIDAEWLQSLSSSNALSFAFDVPTGVVFVHKTYDDRWRARFDDGETELPLRNASTRGELLDLLHALGWKG